MRKFLVGIPLLFVCSILTAQVTIGSMPAVSGSYNGMGPSTVVDLSHPASASGTLTAAAVRWNIGCSNAFKLKFLRLSNLTSYTVHAERGPFNASSGTNLVTLSPPVEVQKGDLIAVTQVASSCGGYFYSFAPTSSMTMFFSGDITPTGTLNGQVQRGKQLDARATSDANVCEGVVPGVGSVAGGFGSFFRTSMQITSRDGKPTTGKLVFHPAGRSGSDSDPSLPFSVPPFSVVSFADVVEAMGQSGLGSLDVISTSGSRPLITVRVFNDAGAAGTSGFTEEIVTLDNVFQPVDEGIITMPADLTNFRMNVGVRALDAGATIDIVVTDSHGAILLPSTTKPAYASNYYEQVSLQQFINNVQPVANGMVRVRVMSGSAIIYTTTTDNRTNDSSIDLAQRE
jgi:hypothetical protein